MPACTECRVTDTTRPPHPCGAINWDRRARDVDRQKVAIYSVINQRKMQQDAFDCFDFESTSFS